jgi:hypothetical protein
VSQHDPIDTKIITPEARANNCKIVSLAEPRVIPNIVVTAVTTRYTAKKIILSFFTICIQLLLICGFCGSLGHYREYFAKKSLSFGRTDYTQTSSKIGILACPPSI